MPTHEALLTQQPALVKLALAQFLDAHAHLVVAIDDGVLDWRGAAVPGQEGGVDVECVEWQKLGEQCGRDEVAE